MVQTNISTKLCNFVYNYLNQNNGITKELRENLAEDALGGPTLLNRYFRQSAQSGGAGAGESSLERVRP